MTDDLKRMELNIPKYDTDILNMLSSVTGKSRSELIRYAVEKFLEKRELEKYEFLCERMNEDI